MLGRLSEKAAAGLEHHLLTCGRCCAILRTLPADDTLVEAMRARAKVALHPADQDVVEGLMGRMRKLRPVAASAHDTATGERTKGDAEPMSANRESFGFLNPPQNPEELGRLGPYRVLKVLGHGGMGMVFLAEDPRLKRTVALKVMLPEVAKKDTARERFLREARATAAIEHDHIITIYQVDEDRGVPYLAMPLLKGMSLESYLKRGKETKKPLTLGQILKLAREIGKGLAAAHERGLIHRDIKPANIWLDATAGGRVKILDFGLARPTETDSTITQSGMIVGTPAYMAPEQAAGQKIDGRADLFSLGVVLYRLCSGRVPWHGETAMATLMAVATEEETPLGQLKPDLPPPLTELVTKLLAKKPEGRPKSAKAVVEAIVAIEKQLAADKVPVAQSFQVEPSQWQQLGEPSETAPLVKVRKPIKKKPRRWPLVAVAAVVLLIGGGVALWQVIIRVETKDGKSAELKVPDRSTVTIKGDGNIIVEPSGKAAAGQGRGVTVTPEWIASVQKLPAEKQVEAVAAKLKELNPRFEGLGGPVAGHWDRAYSIDNGVVTALNFFTDDVTDISPLRALAGLKGLVCKGREKGKLADLAPLRSLSLTYLNCNFNRELADLSPLAGLPLRTLSVGDANVSDLAALKGLPLTDLGIFGTKVRDLSPLRGMKLQRLHCYNTPVRSLEPLAGMPLVWLHIAGTQVADLKPVAGMPLDRLDCGSTQVADLSPLAGVNLTCLTCEHARVTDLSALKEMPLKELRCDFAPARDASILGSIKTLEKINGQPAAEVLKQASAANPAFEQWIKNTQKLAPEKQVDAVAAKLKELNPGFDGKVRNINYENGMVTEFGFHSDIVSDLSPVRALRGLKFLHCDGTGLGKGKLSDLSPLKGMPLTALSCEFNAITDLSPLMGMRLTELSASGLPLDDLSPLKGMPLTHLKCGGTKVSDLSPLKGMQLASFWCDGTPLADLTPIRGMPLRGFGCCNTKVSDLTPLEGTKLEDIRFTPSNIRKGMDVLRRMASLKAIGIGYQETSVWPTAEFWKKYDAGEFNQRDAKQAFEQWIKDTQKLPAQKQVEAVAAKLKELNPDFDGKKVEHKIENGVVVYFRYESEHVTDIKPVRAFPQLERLSCLGPWNSRRGLSDLAPLSGMKLKTFDCQGTAVTDLTPLRGMPLYELNIASTPVANLTPLAGTQLKKLHMHATAVTNLAPLQGLPLEMLRLDQTKVSDLSPLKGVPLNTLIFGSTKVADISVLKGMSLKILICDNTPLADLSAVRGCPLEVLDINKTNVTDLSPLQGMSLTDLIFTPANITKGIDVVRQMKSLKTIGTRPFASDKFAPAEFWKRCDAGEFSK
jgi:serine/threonine protein kinase/Leucine-rich repeat (LRR) protein